MTTASEPAVGARFTRFTAWFGGQTARLRRLGMVLVCGLFAVWAIGQLCGDVNVPLALLFYIPSPVVFVALATGMGIEWWIGSRRRAWVLAAMALAPLLMVLLVENHWRNPAPAPEGPTMRMVHWNCMRGKLGYDRELREILAQHPDMVVISEPPPKNDFEAVLATFREAEPEATWKLFRLRHLMLLARGKFELVKTLEGSLTLDAQLLRWHSPQGPVNLMAIDVISTPWILRDPILEDVKAYMVKYEPDIVVGDFNAPRRSRALRRLPLNYVHAYDAAGSGWGYTWFMPVPMLAIDQCMVGVNARPSRYELQSSWLSDHRRQVLDFRMVREQVAATEESAP